MHQGKDYETTVYTGDSVKVTGTSWFAYKDSFIASDSICISPSALHLEKDEYPGEGAEATKERVFFNSGRLFTKRSFLYGNITVFAKLPVFPGAFPQIYLRPASDEIFAPYTTPSFTNPKAQTDFTDTPSRKYHRRGRIRAFGAQDIFINNYNNLRGICQVAKRSKNGIGGLSCERTTTKWPFNGDIQLLNLYTDAIKTHPEVSNMNSDNLRSFYPFPTVKTSSFNSGRNAKDPLPPTQSHSRNILPTACLEISDQRENPIRTVCWDKHHTKRSFERYAFLYVCST